MRGYLVLCRERGLSYKRIADKFDHDFAVILTHETVRTWVRVLGVAA